MVIIGDNIMTKEFEVTDGKKTITVGLKAIEGGILTRGFHLTDKKLEAEIRATEPYLLPSIETDTKQNDTKVVVTGTVESSNVASKEPAKDVNELVKEPIAPTPKPDFEYALTLVESELDKYAATFGCNLDGRKSLTKLRTEFAEFCGVEWNAPEEDKASDLPEDLECPHCGTKARSEKSYIKNHGDKCYKAITVK